MRSLSVFIKGISFLILFAGINILTANAQQPSFLSSPNNNSTCVSNTTQLVAKDVNAAVYQWEFNTSSTFANQGIVVTSTQPNIVMGSLVQDFVKYYLRIRYKTTAASSYRSWGPTRGITFGNSSTSISAIRIVDEEVRPQYSVTYEVDNNVGSSYTWTASGGTIKSGQGTYKLVTDGKETNLTVTETNTCLRNTTVGNDAIVTRIRVPEAGATDLRTVGTLSPIPVPGVVDSSQYNVQISKLSDFSSLVYDVKCNGSDSAGGRWHPVWGTTRFEYYTDYYVRVKVKSGAAGNVIKLSTGGPKVYAINPGSVVSGGVAYVTLNTAVGAQNYFVELDTVPTFNTSSLIQLTSTKNTFPATNVKFNRTYYIRARANVIQNGIAYTGDWGKIVSFISVTPVTYMITPEDKATNVPKNTTLYCNKIASASSYDWQVSTTQDFSSGVIQATKSVNYANFKTSLLDNTTYYVRVKANVASQNIAGVWGPVYSFTTASTAAKIAFFSGEEYVSSELFAFPNPCSDNLFITSVDDDMQIVITNSMGETVSIYKGNVSGINFSNNLQAGIYTITMIDSAGNTKVQKIVKL